MLYASNGQPGFLIPVVRESLRAAPCPQGNSRSCVLSQTGTPPISNLLTAIRRKERSHLDSLEFGWQVIRYALIFVSAFFRQRASLGCEMVAMRSQLTFYEESIREKRQPRPRFHPAFRLLWVLLSSVWTGWKSAAELMKPMTVLKWHEHAFLKWWRWKSRRKGGRPTISQEMRALIRRLSRENVLWSAETIHGHLVLLGFDPPCPDTIRSIWSSLAEERTSPKPG
jgi:hypothetical protein